MNRQEAMDLMELVRPITRAHSAGMIPVGSWRRGHEKIGDLDILVLNGNIPAIINDLNKIFQYLDIVRVGEKIGTVKVTDKHIQVEFYSTDLKSMGAALLYTTGSGMFNQTLRGLAKRRGLKLNQYGLWRGDDLLASISEEAIFRELGFAFIPPEQRDGTIETVHPVNHKAGQGNMKVANLLEQIAKAYAKKKEPWRAKAFDTAANTIRLYPKPLRQVRSTENLPGVGPSIWAEIQIILKTGDSPRLRQLLE